MSKLDEFTYKYKRMGLTIKQCPHCRVFTVHEYKQGEYIDIYCPHGCGRALTINDGSMSDEEHIMAAINNWNEGKWEQ